MAESARARIGESGNSEHPFVSAAPSLGRFARIIFLVDDEVDEMPLFH